ncbi:MAG TPA: hypothetical protein VN946_00725 [Terriglobales bacterium]|jgi:hypothetical protein|nr:hypothetical protein [Terriglobales bacterium]
MNTAFLALVVASLIAVAATCTFLVVRKVAECAANSLSLVQTEISDLRIEVAALRQAQETSLRKPQWGPSPLAHLHFSDAERVALLSQNSICVRWTKHQLEEWLKNTQLPDAGEAVAFFLEYLQDVLRKHCDAPSASVAINLTAGPFSSISQVTIKIGESSLASNLTGVPELIAKLPELLLASLTPIAHYFSGRDNAKKLAEVNGKLDTSHAFRRMDQKGKLEAIWVSSEENVVYRSPTPEIVAILLTSRTNLYELRRVWQQEIARIVQTTPPPPVVNWGWVRNGWSDKYYRHIAPCVEQAALLQLSLFTEYCISLAVGSMVGFRHTLRQEKPRMDEIVSDFRKREHTLKETQQHESIRQVGDVL